MYFNLYAKQNETESHGKVLREKNWNGEGANEINEMGYVLISDFVSQFIVVYVFYGIFSTI